MALSPFSILSAVPQDSVTKKPIMARTEKLNEVIEALQNLRVVRLTVRDKNGEETVVRVLTYADDPGDVASAVTIVADGQIGEEFPMLVCQFGSTAVEKIFYVKAPA